SAVPRRPPTAGNWPRWRCERPADAGVVSTAARAAVLTSAPVADWPQRRIEESHGRTAAASGLAGHRDGRVRGGPAEPRRPDPARDRPSRGPTPRALLADLHVADRRSRRDHSPRRGGYHHRRKLRP